MKRTILLLLTLSTLNLFAAEPGSSSGVRLFRQQHEHAILHEFIAFLEIPNVASDRENIRRNAAALTAMLKARGLGPRLLEHPEPSTPPVVYGEWKVPGAKRTLIFYAHYDGQPTDPRQWSGTEPWSPALRTRSHTAGGTVIPFPGPGEKINPEWRIYARSASDDKAGVMAILAAVDALKAAKLQPTSNLKFFFDGEEEAGSPHLAQIVSAHRKLLVSDAWIIIDGPVHQTGRKQVVFGVRGDTNVDVTIYGPKRPLHSGHYGNWAPNPAFLLAQLLATMKDASTGKVTIDGWYDDVEPLGAAERKAIAEAPETERGLREELGLSRTEGAGESLASLINLPSLNINGFASGDVGRLARNVIPTTASAVLDLRLVLGNDHRRQTAKLISHVRKQGYLVLDREPTDQERLTNGLIATITSRAGGYNASRTAMDLPLSRNVIEAIQSVSPEPVIKTPTMGGSLPLSVLTETIGAITLTIPIANHDNNQHAENENLRIQNLWDAIEMMAAVMRMK